MKNVTYSEKLKDPRWQKKRLEILQRDEFSCQSCFDDKSTLHVHHRIYVPGEPWEIQNEFLVTLCESCHQRETDEMSEAIAELNKAAKSKFLSTDILSLADILNSIKMVHLPDVVTSALEYWLTDENKMRQIVTAYFEHLVPKESVTADLPF